MFALEVFGASFRQSIVTMFVNVVEAVFFVGDIKKRKMPFTAISTIISGILY